ncbi:MAG TPA: signal peptide peptidase SppA [Nitrospirales bacterium]|nr:signal peptide peptidase SppA [Nitrospirales bacterium]
MSESIPASREPSPLGRGIRTIGLVIAGFFVLVLGITLLVEAIPIASENSIALIRIEGIIIDSHEVLQQIKHFADDSAIQAIVVRINSPGGAVVPSQEIYAALKRIRDDGEKTVVTSMGNMAASGGYYIASASNTILANPGTITGSIGVIMEMTNVEELLAKVGIESVVVKSGLHKDLASPFRPLSVQSRTILQHVMDDVHDQFIHAVAEGREMGVEQVHALADGRIFTGRQALAVNLVDRLGTLQDAIQLAADLAGITEEPTVIEVEPRFSLQDLILTQLRDALYAIIRPDVFRLKFEFAL